MNHICNFLFQELGANKIFFYDLAVHPNVSKLLDYYVKEGTVDLTKYYLPGPQPNSALLRHLYLHYKVTKKRQNEVIPYNDCLYRNIHRFDNIVLLDVDEMIVPLIVRIKYSVGFKSQIKSFCLFQNDNWISMLDDIKTRSPKKISYCFFNVYFMDDMLKVHFRKTNFRFIPQYLHMMQHVFRSKKYNTKGFMKCIHKTSQVRRT